MNGHTHCPDEWSGIGSGEGPLSETAKQLSRPARRPSFGATERRLAGRTNHVLSSLVPKGCCWAQAVQVIVRSIQREFADTTLKINGAAPGHVATDFNDFRGTRTPDEGAAVAVRLATLPADGPTGAVFEDDTQLAW
ncbi:hypothetical protein [Curtobacterium sp. AG1037]|uniref:hypothetical protein n=1 Tax=Curtobacterium sp. AG1037 TaxID=2183990 RepID=UPI0011C0292B|nr:hypothetical protein [Curtobacterium sp. AG1037]